MFKNISFSERIMSSMILLVMVSQFFLILTSTQQILRINKYTTETVDEFGKYALSESKQSLEQNSKQYLNRLSTELANSSYLVLKRFQDQVEAMADEMSSVYDMPSSFGAEDMCYDMEKTFDSRFSVKLRSFAADPSSSKDDGSFALAYDTGLYENTYTTTLEQWNNIEEDEKNNIDEKKAVVSAKKIPNEILQKMMSLTQSALILRPVYTYSIDIQSIYFGTEDSIVYQYGMSPLKQFYDPRKRAWYKDAVEKFNQGIDAVVWQPTYISASDGEVCITCSKAFKDSKGNLAGVLSADMYYDSVARNITDLKVGETGCAFVVDKNADLVIDRSYQKSQNFARRNLLTENIDDSFRSVLTKIKDMQSGVEEAKIDDKECYLAFAPIKDFDWSLCVVVDRQEIIQPAIESNEKINEHITESLENINLMNFWTLVILSIIAIIVVFVTTIVSIVLARNISNPVLELAKTVSNIGKEGLSKLIKIERNDEIGVLSKALNKMTESIKQYVSDLSQTIEEKQKIHTELNVAKRIQAGMLPSIFPAFPTRNDFDIYATMEPAKEVGGDFYDFFFIDKDNLAMVIADVSGKGVAAALFMVISKTLLKNEIQSGKPLNEALNNVNKKLCENNDEGMFVTAFVAVFTISTGELKFSNAGHNHPLIYRKRDDKIEFLKMKRGFVLAGLETIKYNLERTFLDEGDILYLYTDGVTEAMNKENQLFSDERLLNVMSNPKVKTISLKEILAYVRKEITLFADGAEQADDITMLVFKNLKIDIDDDKY